jgi:hypothetical protein
MTGQQPPGGQPGRNDSLTGQIQQAEDQSPDGRWPGPAGQLAPLRLTFARWLNRERKGRAIDGQQTWRWSKVLAHRGSYDQFAYGTDTPSDWSGQLQRCTIHCLETGTIGLDVDDEQAFTATRTAQLTGRADAISTRGARFHILIDARAVPPQDWPKQGPIAGADIKSRGFLPVPGSTHYSGEIYEPVLRDGTRVRIVRWTPELMAAMRADRAERDGKARAAGNGAGGGNGGGHDGELAAAVLGMALRGLDEAQCYAEWLKIAIPRDPAWPFTREDFERHYGGETRGAMAKAHKIRAENEQLYQQAMRWLERSQI